LETKGEPSGRKGKKPQKMGAVKVLLKGYVFQRRVKKGGAGGCGRSCGGGGGGPHEGGQKKLKWRVNSQARGSRKKKMKNNKLLDKRGYLARECCPHGVQGGKRDKILSGAEERRKGLPSQGLI